MSLSATEQGSLAKLKPSELVLRWERTKVSGLFRVECVLGIGFTWFSEGRVVDCRIGNFTGEAAFCCLMGLRTGLFALQSGPVERVPTLSFSTSELVKRYERNAEAWQDLAASLPGLGSMLALDRAKVAEHSAELRPEDKALVRLIDMRRRIHELVQESDAEPRVTLESVARFLRLGFASILGSDAPVAANTQPADTGPVQVHGVRVITEPPSRLSDVTQPNRTSQTVPGMPQVTPTSSHPPPAQPALINEKGVEGARSDPAPASGREALSPGERRLIGRYELLSRLGRGGMGTVYLARATADGGFSRLFALKVLRAHLASDQLATKSLLDEARIASRLNHANVVGVVDVGTHGEQPFVVMDYVHGMSLAELLTFPPEGGDRSRVVPILLDALAGLGAAHNATDLDGSPLQVVHHDVSPHNFLVGLDGVTRLTDFGIARLSADAGQLANRGKPAFLSPERVLGEPVDARSDIFAMGVLMWTALTGEPLFDAGDETQTMRNVSRAHVRPPSEVSKSPRCFDEICLKALQRDPRRRFQTVEAMLLELRAAAEREGYLGSPADVSSWVRTAMGEVADIVFDDPAQIRKFAEHTERRLGRSESSTRPLASGSAGIAGHTVPFSEPKPPRLAVRVMQWLVAFLALVGLVAALLLPEQDVEPFAPAEQAVSGDDTSPPTGAPCAQPSDPPPPTTEPLREGSLRQEFTAPTSAASGEPTATVRTEPASETPSGRGPSVTPASASAALEAELDELLKKTKTPAPPPRRRARRPRRAGPATSPAGTSPSPGKPEAPSERDPRPPGAAPGIPDQRLPVLADPLGTR